MNWFEFISELPDIPLEKVLLKPGLQRLNYQIFLEQSVKPWKKLNLKEFEEVQKIFENDTRVTDIRHGFTQGFLSSVNMPFDWLRATQSQIIKLMESNGLYEQVKQRHLEVISSVAIFGFYGYDPIYSNPFYSTWNSWISENDTKSITW